MWRIGLGPETECAGSFVWMFMIHSVHAYHTYYIYVYSINFVYTERTKY
jgi:hypothetical protein